MTETQYYTCPLCDYSAGSKESVVYHISGKRDDAHQGQRGAEYRSEISLISADSASDSASESPDDSATTAVEFPTAPGSSANTAEESTPNQCCSDPKLEGGEGDHYRLEDGTVLRLEAGESICMTCEEIHG